MRRIVGTLTCVLLAASSCADPNAQFATRLAPDFVSAKHAVSVFGVFKEGLMSPDTWNDVGPILSRAFSSELCAAEYREEWIASNPALSSAIDEYVRSNGVGDPLLDALSPAAIGDLVVVFTIAGHPSKAAAQAGPDAILAPTGPGTMSRNRSALPGTSAQTSAYGPRPVGADADALEVSASIFSVPLHRSIGLVQMRYSGDNMDEGLQRFAAKLGATLPGSRCAAWDPAVRIEGSRIRVLTGS